MITSAERLRLFKETAPERKCPICSPLASRQAPTATQRALLHSMGRDYLRCFLAFVKNISDCEPPTKR
jgi:hypothetical protein